MANPGIRYVFPTENVPGQELLDLINHANSYLNNETFTAISRATLATVIESAREVLGTNSTNILIDSVETAIYELTAAVDGLVLVAELEAARVRLQSLINQMDALNEADLTPASWTSLQQALSAALGVLEREDIAAINAAFGILNTAFDQLVQRQPIPPIPGPSDDDDDDKKPGNGGNQNLPQTGQSSSISILTSGGLLLALGLVIAVKDKKKFE